MFGNSHSMRLAGFTLTVVIASAQLAVAQNHRALYAIDEDGTNLRELAQIAEYPNINSPDIAPDGKWIALDGWKAGEKSGSAHLLFLNLETSEFRDLGPGAMPNWSPDGKWFAYSHYQPRGVSVQSFDGLQNQLIDEDGWGIQWAPDGMKCVYTVSESGGTQLVIYEFVGRSRRHVFPQNDIPYSFIYWNCEWSPDSKQICFKGRRRDGGEDIAIVDVEAGGGRVEVLCDGSTFDQDFGWHPDGSRIVLPGRDGQLYIVDAAAGPQEPRLLPGQPAEHRNSGNCWTLDGKSLIFTRFP
jgi:TolB protein